MWSTTAHTSPTTGSLGNRMVTKPTDTTWQGLLNDTSWRSLSGPSAGSSSSRLGQPEIRQLRQIVTRLFGPDSRVFIRERPNSGGDGATQATVHLMVECIRTLPDRLSAQATLIERLQDSLEGRRIRVLLIDPSFALTEEHKRFRFVAMEY